MVDLHHSFDLLMRKLHIPTRKNHSSTCTVEDGRERGRAVLYRNTGDEANEQRQDSLLCSDYCYANAGTLVEEEEEEGLHATDCRGSPVSLE